MESRFIDITPRSTLSQSASTCYACIGCFLTRVCVCVDFLPKCQQLPDDGGRQFLLFVLHLLTAENHGVVRWLSLVVFVNIDILPFRCLPKLKIFHQPFPSRKQWFYCSIHKPARIDLRSFPRWMPLWLQFREGFSTKKEKYLIGTIKTVDSSSGSAVTVYKYTRNKVYTFLPGRLSVL